MNLLDWNINELENEREKEYLDETHLRQRPVISPLFFFLLFASETLVVDQKHTNTLGCKVGTVLAICILIFKSPTLKGMVVHNFEKYFIPDWQKKTLWLSEVSLWELLTCTR